MSRKMSPRRAIWEFAKKYDLDEAAQVDLEILLKKTRPQKALPKFRLELAKGVEL